MLLLDGRSTTQNILKEINIGINEYENINKKAINILVNWLQISLLDNLNTTPDKSELTLLMLWNDPTSFISFKEKIKIALFNNIKISFHHLKNDAINIKKAINIIDIANSNNSKIIIQLPTNNPEIINAINKIDEKLDIDNLKWIPNKLGCTQSAILGLSEYIIEKYLCNNICILWSEWFIGKWVLNWLKKTNTNKKRV